MVPSFVLMQISNLLSVFKSHSSCGRPIHWQAAGNVGTHF